MARCPLTRRNLLSARNRPATHHRRRMSPSRQRVTRAVTRGRPNGRVTSRHLAADRATLYISPVGCLSRVRQNPANAHGWPRDSLQKAPSVKSLACLEQDRTQPLSWSSVKWRLMTQLLGLPLGSESAPTSITTGAGQGVRDPLSGAALRGPGYRTGIDR
jgi:hypothetical protein